MYAPFFCFSCQRQALGLVLGEFLGGLGPSPTLLAGPSLPKHPAWSARSGGLPLTGVVMVYPTRSAPVLEAPPSFQAPSPMLNLLLMSLNVVKCNLS